MTVLLDTHALLWTLLSPARMSERTRRIVNQESSTVQVSAASLWEIATKVRLGKLPAAAVLESDLPQAVVSSGFRLRSIFAADALRAGRFSMTHRDPFDRMLAAQALNDGCALVSLDTQLDAFGVQRLW